MRAGTLIVLLGLTLLTASCSKCDTVFGVPGVCRTNAPSPR